jgi:hypothetical protein
VAKTSDRAIQTMALVRGLLGAAAYIDPDRTARAMGLDPDRNTQMRYLGRVFGARDMALGAALLASTGEGRRKLLWACVGIEVLDTASALIALRTGTIGKAAAIRLVGAVVAAAIPETVALSAPSSDTQA